MSVSYEIIYGSPNSVARAVKNCSGLNYIDEYNFTPLIQSAISDNIEMARILLENGADPNFRDLSDSTALHWAVDNHNKAFCELLLEYGADPNAYNLISQPILVKALLRQQHDVRFLLCQHGANITFAQDFINTKLLGHRFELIGRTDIVDHLNRFTEIDFEGFFLEFSVDVIRSSLADYKNNFAARHLSSYFKKIKKIVDALTDTAELCKYMHYLVQIDKHLTKIELILQSNPIIIPVAQEGHASTLIKYNNYIAIIDRAQNENFADNIVIYQMNQPQLFNLQFIKDSIYTKQSRKFLYEYIPAHLELTQLTTIEVPTQITGNCTWANVEACIPTLLFLLSLHKKPKTEDIQREKDNALNFFQQWIEWDQERELRFCIDSFSSANRQRKAAKAAVLAAILFQRCLYGNKKDMARADRIIPILKTPGFEYILKAYMDVYWNYKRTDAGENLRRLLTHYDQTHFDDF